MTNLSAPFDTPPYTEIDKYPHHQQTDSQLRHNTPTIFYGIRDLDHMVSYLKKKLKLYYFTWHFKIIGWILSKFKCPFFLVYNNKL